MRAAEDGLSLRRKPAPRLDAGMVWDAYTAAQLIPRQLDGGLEEVDRRYGRRGLAEALHRRLRAYVDNHEVLGLSLSPDTANQQMGRAAAAIGAEAALDLLPDEEFLTAYQDAIEMIGQHGREGEARADHMRQHCEKVFRTYGLPYAVRDGRITWSGDAFTRTEVFEPALTALDDRRVSGARDEFLQARAALRGGTPSSLRDATHEAGNAVEATLHALIDAHGLALPKSKTAAPLFNLLREAGVLPAALESTVMAAPLLRNAQGGHTQGATVTNADRRIAETALSAAAVAITALVAFLP